MAALVDESHRLRKKVAVHCHGDQAAHEAIEAGVDSIEHGSFMKPETLTMMKKKGTFLTPTLMADGMDHEQDRQLPAGTYRPKPKQQQRRARRCFATR